MKHLFKTAGRAALTLLTGTPLLALAQGSLPPPPFSDPGGAIAVLCNIAGWIFIFLIVFAIFAVLYAAFKYLTAGGDPGAISTAGNILIYAAIAVAVAIFAKGFPLLVAGLIGGTVAQQC